jgi:glycosyltransferase involved in cell wall biosynthesis
MRIAVLSHTATPTPSPASGLANVVSNAAEGLRNRGHDVTLFAAQGSRFNGELVTVPVDYNGEAKLAHAVLQAHKQRPYEVLFDHSHTHQLSQLFPHAPVVNCHHDRWQERRPCSTLVSEGQRALMEHGDFSTARVLRNALDAGAFTPSWRHDGYLAYVGVFRAYKQPALAVEAATRANVPLHMCGAGAGDWFSPYTAAQYLGELPPSGVYDLYRGAACLLQLGYMEAMPMTNIEAGLHGCPVVAWPTGGNLDYVNPGVNGVLIDTTRADIGYAIADAVHEAMELPRKRVRDYTAETFGNIEAWLDCMEQLLLEAAGGAKW